MALTTENAESRAGSHWTSATAAAATSAPGTQRCSENSQCAARAKTHWTGRWSRQRRPSPWDSEARNQAREDAHAAQGPARATQIGSWCAYHPGAATGYERGQQRQGRRWRITCGGCWGRGKRRKQGHLISTGFESVTPAPPVAVVGTLNPILLTGFLPFGEIADSSFMIGAILAL